MSFGKGKPTQKTIAELTGLAVTTVSRALKGDPKIAKATRTEVAKVAEKVGYVPDRAAQRLRTGKTRTISLILNPHDEILGFGNSMISGLTQSLEGSEYNLTITPNFSQKDELAPIERLVRNGLADGIILTRTRNFDERIRFLLEQDFPFICHGRTDFSQPHNYVDFDNEEFANLAARRLVEQGCTTLIILPPDQGFTFHQHLRYGFMRAVREAGIAYEIPNDVTLQSPAEDIKTWVQKLARTVLKSEFCGFVCPGEASYLALNAGLRDVGLLRGVHYQAVVKTNSTILEQIDPNLDLVFEDICSAGLRMGEGLLSVLGGGQKSVWQIVQEPVACFAEELHK